MSRKIFVKNILVLFFTFSIFINISFAGTKNPGEVCKVLSGDSSNSECIAGYSCQGGTGVGTSGVCTAIPSKTTQNTSIPASSVTDFSDIGSLLTNFNKNILQNLIMVLSGAALVVFLWGLVRFIYDRSSGNADKIAKDREAMLWGLGALFILVSVWGIIKMFQGFLGISSNNDVNIPRICVNGSCNTPSTQAGGAGGITQGGGVFNDPSSGLLDGSYTVDSIRGWSLPIKKGSKGKDVAELQQFLKNHNINVGSKGVDGDFGTDTENAVKAFQKANALAQDGVVGYATRAVILYRYEGGTNDTNYQLVSKWPDMQYGSKNSNVGEMQSILKALDCYKSGNDSSDDIFGPATKAALINFQNANFLKEDGIVGPSTRAVFMAEDSTVCN